MRFAHMADIHIGSWRDPRMKLLGIGAFSKAIDVCIHEKVDFILISGDIFNTAMPGIDLIKQVAEKLRQVKDSNIPIYIIAGSHDYSVSGKTMLDVLEIAGFWKNVLKGKMQGNSLNLEFTIDPKTGAKIAGMAGRAGSLESTYYENLARAPLETEPGFKIFLFHSGIKEYMPTDFASVEAHPLSYLPKNFNYYAGGHIHYVFAKEEPGFGTITFPGPLFPCNFKELRDLKRGTFNIVEADTSTGKIVKIMQEAIELHKVDTLELDCDHLSAEQVAERLTKTVMDGYKDRIVMLRLKGTLSSGKISDLPLKEFTDKAYAAGAYFVMRSTTALSSPQYEEIKTGAASVEEIEETLLKEHKGQFPLKDNQEKDVDELHLAKSLIEALSSEKSEGEKAADFEARIEKEAKHLLEDLGILSR